MLSMERKRQTEGEFYDVCSNPAGWKDEEQGYCSRLGENALKIHYGKLRRQTSEGDKKW